MNGIICVNKPSGWTSFDVVAKMRRIAKMKKIGHAGTLDPMATGVLPLFLGVATKACDLIPRPHKQYLSTLQLGVTTDTLDKTGEILHQCPSQIKKEVFSACLPRFRGDIFQCPPMYSACKVGGKRLYELARAGKTIERTPRPVTITQLSLVSFEEGQQTATLRVTCSKGTYIRTLVDDIGSVLGVGAMLTDLVREMAADYFLSDCYDLEQLQQAADENYLHQLVRPIDSLFQCYPTIILNADQSKRMLNGVTVSLDCLSPLSPSQTNFYRLYNSEHHFLGLGSANITTQQLQIKKSFLENK